MLARKYIVKRDENTPTQTKHALSFPTLGTLRREANQHPALQLRTYYVLSYKLRWRLFGDLLP
jgi:hypothetical protein